MTSLTELLHYYYYNKAIKILMIITITMIIILTMILILIIMIMTITMIITISIIIRITRRNICLSAMMFLGNHTSENSMCIPKVILRMTT